MKENKKKILISIFLLMILAVSGIVLYYWYNNTYYVSTDDATIQGDLVKATPQISGKLLEINIKDGQSIEKGQIIARQDLNTLPDTSMDLSNVRAPISGIVLKKQGTVGEMAAPGQAIAIMVDLSALYITANIDETKLKNIKLGQNVDISVDEYNGSKFTGKVITIGDYANSALAVIPTSTSGTFTKVTQKIPVKISLPKTNYRLLPGTNVVVKIHVK